MKAPFSCNWLSYMQLKRINTTPLTPTLSPSEGERESLIAV